MEQLEQQVEILTKKIDELQLSINKIKKIFFWILILSVVSFVLPLIGLLFAIPQFLSSYGSALQ
ncbi:MAG: hypothetical protein Q7R75_00500 [bacterium]|nr:hypothetical protein [bacterium]